MDLMVSRFLRRFTLRYPRAMLSTECANRPGLPFCPIIVLCVMWSGCKEKPSASNQTAAPASGTLKEKTHAGTKSTGTKSTGVKTPDPSPTPIPKPTYPNRFSMSKTKARKLGLPPVTFSLSYPAGLEVIAPKEGVRSDNYFGLLVKTKDGKLREVLTIGHSPGLGGVNAKGQAGNMAKGLWRKLIDQIARSLKKQYPKGKIAVVDGVWHGVRGPQVRATLHVKDPKQRLDNDVLMLILCVPPPPGSPNGVMLLMQAIVGNSDVKTFADFERKGMPAQVWKTFGFAKVK